MFVPYKPSQHICGLGSKSLGMNKHSSLFAMEQKIKFCGIYPLAEFILWQAAAKKFRPTKKNVFELVLSSSQTTLISPSPTLRRADVARFDKSRFYLLPLTTGGLYYKTLRTCNLRKMERFHSKLMPLQLFSLFH